MTAKTPLYLRIADHLRKRIDNGELAPGEQLLPETQLAESYGVARMTVRQALEVLQEEGLIGRKRGRRGGTFVKAAPPQIELTRIDGILPQLRERGQAIESRVISARELQGTYEVCSALEIDEGNPVYQIVRLRSIRGVPTLLENSYFPAEIFPDLLSRDLTSSIYELLEHYNRRPVAKVEEIIVALCSPQEMELMQVTKARQLLRIMRVARDSAGTVVELSEDLIRYRSTRIVVKTPARPNL